MWESREQEVAAADAETNVRPADGRSWSQMAADG